VPASVHIPDPIFNVEAALAVNSPAVTLYVTASKVPDVSVRVRAEFNSSASASCTVPVPQSIVRLLLNVVPLFVMVVVPLPKKVTVPPEPRVTPDPIVQLPYKKGAAFPALSVIADVLAEASIEPILNTPLVDTVPAEPVSSKTAVS
jgi:hypothetical protein